MKITMCGSIKFMDEMIELQKQLEELGHIVYMPIKIDYVDYWSEDNISRVAAKQSEDLVSKHMRKIEDSDAILVANYTKGDTENYIGANTFIEMAFAHYREKRMYVLNSLPSQEYIKDELESFNAKVIDGNVSKII